VLNSYEVVDAPSKSNSQLSFSRIIPSIKSWVSTCVQGIYEHGWALETGELGAERAATVNLIGREIFCGGQLAYLSMQPTKPPSDPSWSTPPSPSPDEPAHSTIIPAISDGLEQRRLGVVTPPSHYPFGWSRITTQAPSLEEARRVEAEAASSEPTLRERETKLEQLVWPSFSFLASFCLPCYSLASSLPCKNSIPYFWFLLLSRPFLFRVLFTITSLRLLSDAVQTMSISTPREGAVLRMLKNGKRSLIQSQARRRSRKPWKWSGKLSKKAVLNRWGDWREWSDFPHRFSDFR
jgi:hypothetical protein